MNRFVKTSLIVTVGICGLLAYGVFIEPNWIEITHLDLRDMEFPAALKGKCAVHLTDLHVERFGKKEEKILSLLETLQPDMVFLTGDYVMWRGDETGGLQFLSRIQAPVGAWAVMGDYDYSLNRRSCLFCHDKGTALPTRNHSVQFLRNTAQLVQTPAGCFPVTGVDKHSDENIEMEGVIGNKTDEYSILLSHDPIFFDEIDSNKKIFVLSGDTHGGQIALPSQIFGWIGYEKNHRYNQGLFKENNKRMYVSRGLGTSHVPIRLFRRPEIVVLHF